MPAISRRSFVLVWPRLKAKTIRLPFWLMPFSSFGMSLVTGFITDLPKLTFLPKPSPLPREARSSALPSRVQLHPFGMGYIVRMAPDKAVTGPACTPRLPLEEQRVRSSLLMPNNRLCSFTSH